jgi:DNA-binding CsgD family transcriptional regulator
MGTTAAGPKLTAREKQVLTLIGEGNSSQDVADAMDLSKRTIDFHLANIYNKLGVKNRVKALREAARYGLIKRA